MSVILEALVTHGIRETRAAIDLFSWAQYIMAVQSKAGVSERYFEAAHLRLMCEVFEEIESGNFPQKGVIVSMPPRHSKSTTGSFAFPTWFLGRNPEKRVILTSYNDDLASYWGRKGRDAYATHGMSVFGHGVNKNSKSSSNWETDAGGGLLAAGAGGPLTGFGADLLIIDDIVKNAEEALSKRFRDRAWDWWLSTASSRLEPGGKVIIPMTRWHEDDLAGRLLKNEPEEWKEIKFSAICTDESDALGRKEGEALWPERFDEKYFAKLKNSFDHDETKLGPYWWDALYQQEPVPRGGGIFKREWFKYADKNEVGDKTFFSLQGMGRSVCKDDLWIFITADLAISKKTNADYTVFCVWGMTDRRDLILLDRYRGKISAPDQVNVMESLYRKWNASFIGVESVAYQKAFNEFLLERGLPGYEIKVHTDKISRSATSSTLMSAGKIFFPSWASWLNEWEDEVLSFPAGANDDQVDNLSMAGQQLSTIPTGELGVI